MINFNNSIYAGTSSWGVAGAIWRTSDGRNWEKVNTDGFGSTNNRSVDAFGILNNMLYASEYNNNGLEIYSTQDGLNWSKVVGSGLNNANSPGFGNSNNISVSSFYTLDKILYAGTYNEKGCEIWSLTDGKNWTKMVGQGLTGSNASGFGDVNNNAIDVFGKFNNYLYAGTDSSYYDEAKGLYLSKTGFEVWREKIYDKAAIDPISKLNISQNKYLWIAIIVLVVVAIILALFFWRKRKNEMY
jgi:hypothetical protein